MVNYCWQCFVGIWHLFRFLQYVGIFGNSCQMNAIINSISTWFFKTCWHLMWWCVMFFFMSCARRVDKALHFTVNDYTLITHSRVFVLVPPLQWHHNGHWGVSNHQPHDCLLNRLFRRRSKKTSKLRVTGLFAGNSPVAGEFPAQMASNAENVSIWWRHHAFKYEEDF